MSAIQNSQIGFIAEYSMSSIVLREKIDNEIKLIPDSSLDELYSLIHAFRMRLEKRNTSESLMSFAGCWEDMSEEMFEAFSEEVVSRREQAFKSRRDREAGVD